MGRAVHSLTLSIGYYLCRPRRCPPSKMPRGMVLERTLWRVTCPNHASFRLLTVARRGSCGPTRKLVLLRTQSLTLCSKEEMRRSFLRYLVSKACILFSEWASRVHVSATEEDGRHTILEHLELACEDGQSGLVLQMARKSYFFVCSCVIFLHRQLLFFNVFPHMWFC